MEQEKLIKIDDESKDKRYFTIIPNFILNHSTAIDQALYSQMKRLTEEEGKNICYPSFNYLMKQLKIGKGNLRKSIKYLIKNRWIDDTGKRRVRTKGGYQMIQSYKINDIWKLNMEYYQRGQGGAENTPLAENQGGSETIKGGAENEQGGAGYVAIRRTIKEEPLKNNNKEICFLLKDWNERQLSPIANFIPENIVNKYGVVKIGNLFKKFGPVNNGFSQFLSELKK